MRANKRPLAEIDIFETADYIAQDNLDAGIRFLVAVEETIEKLKSSPKKGTLGKVRGQEYLRMWFVLGFPKSLIFYFVKEGEIEIVRVIHSSRDYRRVFEEE